jgi:hypothetical protein
LLKSPKTRKTPTLLLSDVDAAGETLATVKKVARNPRIAAKGCEPSFIGLTQVVFDRMQMMDGLHLTPNAAVEGPEGTLEHYGMERSDKNIADFI